MKKLKIDEEFLKEVKRVKVKNHYIIDTYGFVASMKWDNELNGMMLICSIVTTNVKPDYHLLYDDLPGIVTETKFITGNEGGMENRCFRYYLYDVICELIRDAEYEIGRRMFLKDEAGKAFRKILNDKGNYEIDWCSMEEYIKNNYCNRALSWCYKILDQYSEIED